MKDDLTLIITAARRDRRSFGSAFFKEALHSSKSLPQAFEKASSLVDEWERADAAKTSKPAAADHHSLPQIHNSIAIETHLEH